MPPVSVPKSRAAICAARHRSPSFRLSLYASLASTSPLPRPHRCSSAFTSPAFFLPSSPTRSGRRGAGRRCAAGTDASGRGRALERDRERLERLLRLQERPAGAWRTRDAKSLGQRVGLVVGVVGPDREHVDRAWPWDSGARREPAWGSSRAPVQLPRGAPEQAGVARVIVPRLPGHWLELPLQDAHHGRHAPFARAPGPPRAGHAAHVRPRARGPLRHPRLGGARIDGARVLDLYAGTGALALEALSRGAADATLVESARDALAVARANVASSGVRGPRARRGGERDARPPQPGPRPPRPVRSRPRRPALGARRRRARGGGPAALVASAALATGGAWWSSSTPRARPHPTSTASSPRRHPPVWRHRPCVLQTRYTRRRLAQRRGPDSSRMSPPLQPSARRSPRSGGNAKYAIVAVVLLLGAGGLFAWRSLTNRDQAPAPPPPFRQRCRARPAAAQPAARRHPAPASARGQAGGRRPAARGPSTSPAAAARRSAPASRRPSSRRRCRSAAAQARRCYNSALGKTPRSRGT